MMKFTTLTLSLLLITSVSFADQGTRDMPSISTTQVMQITAQVMAVSVENKTVALKGPQGNVRVLELPDAQRLDEVEVGDTVAAEYVQNLTLELFPGSGGQPGHGTMSAKARAPESERPGGIVTETSIYMAVVREVDLENNTFKLEWEDGIKDYMARDPENLKKAKVGDYVVATYTTALAMQLQEVPEAN